MRRWTWAALLAAAVMAWAGPALARTKLTALPDREKVTIRLDNPAATLVEEERVLTLEAGENQVDFSWRGVAVDPDSIRVAFLSHPEGVTLLSVAYPPGEGALVWRIHAAGAGEERVRISYLLAGIDRLVAYRARADKEEKTVALTGLLILRNFSGEDFGEAEIALDGGRALTRPSAHEETRRSVLFEVASVPVKKTFTWDAAIKPWEPKLEDSDVGVPVAYEVVNDAASGLGTGPLWAGKVRVEQDDGHGGTIFLGEDNVEFTPPGGTMKIRIGESRDVSVTQRLLSTEERNHRPSREKVRLYDVEESFAAEVENFKDLPVTVELVEHVQGQWEMTEAGNGWERDDASTFRFLVEVGPKAKKSFTWKTLRRNVRR